MNPRPNSALMDAAAAAHLSPAQLPLSHFCSAPFGYEEPNGRNIHGIWHLASDNGAMSQASLNRPQCPQSSMSGNALTSRRPGPCLRQWSRSSQNTRFRPLQL